ncbi:ABC transporter ATP-binding protein [Serratia sp. DD3]|uniref:ABC transporter ATP-binding protein n=1 Tax=Serratia sp. DD3 TaxID=1410619 RepID=UPI0003C5100A|nr:ABC transporter ATP-binding protein [Serratia sp. DD3]KEY60905.1 putative D,D-dipeptide transport ATP-binding protein DdpD [Serratia sp. DD3]
MEQPLLQIHSFSVSFGAFRVLNNINLNLAPGEILALVGESGSGKSVLARSIIGCAGSGAQLEGKVLFQDTNLTATSEKELTALRGGKISLMLQDALSALNPVYTIGRQMMETISLKHPWFVQTPGAQGGRPNKVALRKLAINLLREAGLDRAEEYFSAYPHQLSGGMCQRVMLALALVGEPRLLIADEPTTALDVVVQKQILHRLVQNVRARGAALLLISHDLHLVSEFTDRIVVLYAGQIMESGPTRKLLANPRHPYTRGLLEAMPQAHTPKGALRPIPGEVPAPWQRDQGCLFQGRCPNAQPGCSFPQQQHVVENGWVSFCGQLPNDVTCYSPDPEVPAYALCS